MTGETKIDVPSFEAITDGKKKYKSELMLEIEIFRQYTERKRVKRRNRTGEKPEDSDTEGKAKLLGKQHPDYSFSETKHEWKKSTLRPNESNYRDSNQKKKATADTTN